MTDAAPSLAALAADLASGATSSRDLVEGCLDRIARSSEGATTFLAVATEGARAAADAMDLLRRAGAAPSPWAGIPISIKDLFDIAGEVTTAGSVVLADRPPARLDAPAVARLRRAGFVVIGRTNMTEFAYSGLGLNPHHGTPRSVWGRDEGRGRVPGGSSSGAAVSVAEGMAHAALGTDTGGSCRIPAAFNRLVGFKPTAHRVPREGAIPLSTTLDSIGPIARTTECCAVLDAILAGEEPVALDCRPVAGLRLAVPTTHVLDGLDPAVAEAFAAALKRLGDAGAAITEIEAPEFAEIPSLGAGGGFTAAEAYAWHEETLTARGEAYDRRVAARLRVGATRSAVDHLRLVAARRRLIDAVAARFAGFDAVVMPTVAVVPPRIADLDDDEAYVRTNLLVLRNTSLINMIDGCAVSLPIGGDAPVGLMVSGIAGTDRTVLTVARAIEQALGRPGRS